MTKQPEPEDYAHWVDTMVDAEAWPGWCPCLARTIAEAPDGVLEPRTVEYARLLDDADAQEHRHTVIGNVEPGWTLDGVARYAVFAWAETFICESMELPADLEQAVDELVGSGLLCAEAQAMGEVLLAELRDIRREARSE